MHPTSSPWKAHPLPAGLSHILTHLKYVPHCLPHTLPSLLPTCCLQQKCVCLHSFEPALSFPKLLRNHFILNRCVYESNTITWHPESQETQAQFKVHWLLSDAFHTSKEHDSGLISEPRMLKGIFSTTSYSLNSYMSPTLVFANSLSFCW